MKKQARFALLDSLWNSLLRMFPVRSRDLHDFVDQVDLTQATAVSARPQFVLRIPTSFGAPEHMDGNSIVYEMTLTCECQSTGRGLVYLESFGAMTANEMDVASEEAYYTQKLFLTAIDRARVIKSRLPSLDISITWPTRYPAGQALTDTEIAHLEAEARSSGIEIYPRVPGRSRRDADLDSIGGALPDLGPWRLSR